MIIAAALVAVALAAHPAERPQPPRAAKSESANSAAKTENANSPKDPSQTGTSPVATGQPAAQTRNANPESETENEHIQRRIEVFTGVLAIVAVFQLVVGFLTWLIYRQQAGIMEGQRQTMQGQLTTMHDQLAQMESQTGVLKESVAHAETSAEVAIRSIKLQEAPLKQWLATENWNLVGFIPLDTATEAKLEITFEIVNPTKMPITLKYIWSDGTYIWGNKLFGGGIQLTYLLAPNSRYPIRRPFAITGEDFVRLKGGKIGIAINCKVDFRDIFGNAQVQFFGKTCDFTRHGLIGFKDFDARIRAKNDEQAN